MSETPQAGPAPGAPQQPSRLTVSRPVGIAIAAVAAAVGFGAGSALWPAPEAPATVAQLPPPPPPPPPSPPPPPAPPAIGSAADAQVSADAMIADSAGPSAPADSQVPTPEAPQVTVAEEKRDREQASDTEEGSGERGSKKKKKKKGSKKSGDATRGGPDGGESGSDGGDAKGDNSLLPPSDGTAPGASADQGKDASADCALPEKDIAREAWRRNWPTICPIAGAGKAFIIIPIKGPIEGETHQLHRRPTREARVVLPEGADSQLTMKQYKTRRLGFKELRINATEEGGTRLRVKLQPGAGDPVFDVKDGYAKITVATPSKD